MIADGGFCFSKPENLIKKHQFFVANTSTGTIILVITSSVFAANCFNMFFLIFGEHFKIKKISVQTKLLPKICRKPFFIPETKMVDELFYILKQKHTHIAICLNDQGMVSGLVTMEDLLEELFGEIYDEHDMGGAR